jgi:hypothetical protein
LPLPAHPAVAPACRRPRDVVPKRLGGGRPGTPLDPTTEGDARCATGTGDRRHPESPRTGRNGSAQLELVTTDTSDPDSRGPASGRNGSAQLELVTTDTSEPCDREERQCATGTGDRGGAGPGADVAPGRRIVTSPDGVRSCWWEPSTFQRDDGGITIGLVTARGAVQASRIGPQGAAADRFVGLVADLPGMGDLPGVTPDTSATSPAEVARGCPTCAHRRSPSDERLLQCEMRRASRVEQKSRGPKYPTDNL